MTIELAIGLSIGPTAIAVSVRLLGVNHTMCGSNSFERLCQTFGRGTAQIGYGCPTAQKVLSWILIA